jgi:hypothetical protein
MLIGSPSFGLGADTPDSGSFDTGVAGGSFLTALVLGLGIIVAAKTVFAPTTRRSAPKRRWVAGAYRSDDYEERLDPEWGRSLVRKRRGRAA